MNRTILHFAHANGFPAGCYNKLLCSLNKEYTVIAIDQLGHNPQYPVDNNWESLTQELIDYIKCNAGEPVIGVGHSLGGILTFMAAYHRPELFKEIIVMDPPLAYGFVAFSLYLAKKLRLIDRVQMVSRTKKRRTHWSSHEEAEAYFKSKSAFKHFDTDCLRDYIQYGTMSNETGIHLRFDVSIETEIFKTTPHNLNCFKKNSIVPGSVIVGEHSYVSLRDLKQFAKKFELDLVRFEDGSHLFPLEYPERTATLIMEIINKLEAKR